MEWLLLLIWNGFLLNFYSIKFLVFYSCKKCNFAIDMEVDKTVNKVFDCIACEYKMCRLCERDWDDEHFGYSCEELDAKNKKEKRDRALFV